MPLLMCLNDNASMQTLNRNGVEFDMCPACRGVWLDRGELEKLIENARATFAAEAVPAQGAPQQARRPQPPPLQPYHDEHRERGEHGERGEYGGRDQYDQHGRRRKRGFDLFDIFD